MKDKAADGRKGNLCHLQARSYTGMFNPIIYASRKDNQDLIKKTLATATSKHCAMPLSRLYYQTIARAFQFLNSPVPLNSDLPLSRQH